MPLLTFEKYTDREEAFKAAAILNMNGIDAEIEDPPPLLDHNIIGQQITYILLKLNGKDFDKAREILLRETVVNPEEVDENYMLLSFTDEELLDVVAKQDEWGIYNYKLALTLLERRGVNITEVERNKQKENYITQASARKQADKWLLIAGYAASITSLIGPLLWGWLYLSISYTIYFLPGILGIIFGITILNSKKTLPDGTQVISYNENSRRHARYMLIIGIIALVVNLFIFGGNTYVDAQF